ncbi:transient receptor potential channel pyrexia [Harpegnathos saltator]|uniref:transient receptor potential channel pyrexia n=1 Tax=Harpegnathos saltator TaxID=610380 RepID=UPI000DBEDEA5|nr:transient receptor potential channel pyrexia [Harpegnathos saltator]
MPPMQRFAEAAMRERDPDHVALMSALENGELERAAEILARDSQNKYIQPIGALQVTALHMAAWQGRIDLLDLLYVKGANVNATDKIGRGALYYAAYCGYADVTRWILQHGGDTQAKVGVNSCTKDLYKSPLVKSSFIGKVLPLPVCWGRTPLHQAVKNNHADVVRLLVEAGADVNAKDENLVSPLLLAGSAVNRDDSQEMAKFVEIIKTLVSGKAFVNIIHPDTGTTALHHAAGIGSAEATKLLLTNGAWPMFKCKSSGSTPLHIAASAGSLETLITLLRVIQPHCIDTCDQVNQTALHLASYQGHSDCVRMLIKCGGNLAAMTKTGVTAVDAIFAHMPRPLDFLKDILDSCVQMSSNCSSEKYNTITVDFSILAPKYHMQMRVMTAIIAATSSVTQLAILQHPLVETFLRLKWAKLRIFFFLLVLVHIVFVISLSSYALMLLQNENYVLHRGFLGICACIILIHNMIQVLLEPRHYSMQFETWLSFMCVVLSLATSIAGKCVEYTKDDIQQGLQVQTTQATTEMKGTQAEGEKLLQCPEWLLHCMSINILLGWVQMMLLIGRFPMWGYYALIFSAVLKNMLKMLLAFGYLIVGFALSFAVLFHGGGEFCDLWRAIVRTVVMMMGEYEYEDLLKQKHLRITTRIVFFIFTMLVSVVLINLMIGLAVNDIQGIEKEGHIRRLLKQAEFIAHLERVTSHRIFRSSWLRPRLSIHSSRDIPAKMTLSYRENYSHRASHIEAPRDIPCELKEALFLLATKSCFMSDNSAGDRNAEDTDVKLSSLLNGLEGHLRKLRPRCSNNLTSRKLTRPRRNKRKFKPRNVINL